MQTFESYLKTEAGLSDATIDAYLYDIKQYFDLVDGDPFELCLVDQFVKKISDHNKSNTVKRKQMSVMAFYRYLISNDFINADVLDGIVSVQSEEPEIKVHSQKEIQKLIHSLSGSNKVRDRAIILLMYQSGLRVSEVCTLRVVDIIWGSSVVRVTGKGRVERLVPISQDCKDVLGSYTESTSEGRIFNISRYAITDMVTRTANRAGIKHTTSHTLRHTCATSLMEGGMPIETIQSILGHSDLSTTQKYLSISRQRLKETHRICHPRP